MSQQKGAVLVINAGSSSIKFAIFDTGLAQQFSGMAEGIGGSGKFVVTSGGTATQNTCDFRDHQQALQAILRALSDHGIGPHNLAAAAHRVVHGGTELVAPCLITPQVRNQIEANIPLAPLHNPHNLAGIDALHRLAPNLPQCATFDTGFHATNPEVALRYALPDAINNQGIRRYGFHGTSYAALVEALPRISEAPLPTRLLALHLGNGASLCAIHNGQSVATTMGYSPVSGLTMGTRSGDIDANAVLHMAICHGIENTRHLLNHESGLAGLSGGLSDMRRLAQTDNARSRFTIDHFCYWVARHAGSMVAAMGGCDALAFTGGIGENAADIRTEIMDRLGWLGLQPDATANSQNAPQLHDQRSQVQAWIVPAEEERYIASDALGLLNIP